MNRIWYLGIGGHPVGPLGSDEVAGRLRLSQADGETLVWREGMGGWRTLATSELAPLLAKVVEELEPEAPVAAPEPAVVAAPAAPLATVISLVPRTEPAVRAEVPPRAEAPQKTPEKTEAPAAARVRYGGFWRRAIALAIDGLLTTIVSAALTVFFALQLGLYFSDSDYAFHAVGQTMHGLSPFIAAFVFVLYFGAVQGVRGATFGKWACGLRVTRPDGRPLGVPRGIVRAVAWVFSGLAAGSGYLIAGLHPRKRSWHDIVSGTVVVEVPIENSAKIAVDELSSSGQSQTARPAA